MTLAGTFPPLAVQGAVERRGVLCAIDGTIDNSAATAAELGLPPTATAEDVLVAGFERFGEGVFERLRGSFVALVWDGPRGRGAIARDRIGERPLHLAERPGGGGLVFASEIADLLAALPSRPPPDEAWLAHWLARELPPRELTPFAGIRRLPAGQLVRLEGERWSIAPWWRPRPAAPLAVDAVEAAALLHDAMAAAVERAVRDTGAPAVRLSGGFDSACVAGLASRERPLGAYSAVFPDHGDADESGRIAALRDGLGLTGVEQSLDGGGALGESLDFLLRWEVPPASPNLYVWRGLMRRAAEDGVDVLLDGEGGDETFGASTALLADLLRRGRLVELVRQARRIPGMGSRPRPRWVRNAIVEYGLRAAIPPYLHERLRRARRAGRAAGPAWLADSLRARLAGSRGDDWKAIGGPRWWAQRVELTGATADALGSGDYLHRVATDAGLRTAHPWRDSELIDLVLRLPPELAFDPVLDRRLARAAVDGVVPDVVRLSGAKPFFNEPLAGALAGPDRRLVRELALGDELRPYVARDRLTELLDASGAGPAWPLDVWRACTAGAFLRVQSDRDWLCRAADRAERPRAKYIEGTATRR